MTVSEAKLISPSPYSITRTDLCIDDVVEYQDRKFRLIRKIGEGSNNTIYKVKDLSTLESLAFKVSKGLKKYDLETLELLNARIFDREDPRLKYILHIDAHFSVHLGEKEKSIFLHKKFKCDLKQHLQEKKRLKLDEIRKIFSDVLQGLSYFHERDVYHGDIKPANILLDKTGRCVLTDFDFTTALPCRIFPVQSEGYRAPEAPAKQYTTIIDMWSIGCIAIELYKGSFHPREIKNAIDVDSFDAILSDPLDVRQENVMEKLLFTQFISGCLKVNHTERMTALNALNSAFMKFDPCAMSFASFVYE